MNFFDLEHLLPHGFHDSIFHSISIDYEKDVLSMKLEVMWGEMDDVEWYPCMLFFKSIKYIIIGSPYSGFTDPPSDLGSSTDLSIAEQRYDNTQSSKLPRDLGPEYFALNLFLSAYNSSIFLAAKDAMFYWIETPPDMETFKARDIE